MDIFKFLFAKKELLDLQIYTSGTHFHKRKRLKMQIFNIGQDQKLILICTDHISIQLKGTILVSLKTAHSLEQACNIAMIFGHKNYGYRGSFIQNVFKSLSKFAILKMQKYQTLKKLMFSKC